MIKSKFYHSFLYFVPISLIIFITFNLFIAIQFGKVEGFTVTEILSNGFESIDPSKVYRISGVQILMKEKVESAIIASLFLIIVLIQVFDFKSTIKRDKQIITTLRNYGELE